MWDNLGRMPKWTPPRHPLNTEFDNINRGRRWWASTPRVPISGDSGAGWGTVVFLLFLMVLGLLGGGLNFVSFVFLLVVLLATLANLVGGIFDSMWATIEEIIVIFLIVVVILPFLVPLMAIIIFVVAGLLELLGIIKVPLNS